MSWPMQTPGQWHPGMAMAPNMNVASYTPEQWAAMQQNWQQWTQWQQQYAQWQSQYGEKVRINLFKRTDSWVRNVIVL